MRVATTLLAVGLLPGTLTAQALTTAEREALVNSLTETRGQLVELAERLSEAQWNFKPAPDRWSVGEVAEHILVSEQFFMQLVSGPLMQQMRTADMPPAGSRVEGIRTMMLDRSQRFQAPDQAKPTGRWPTQAELIEAFHEQRAATIAAAMDADADLHAHALEHPALGMADGHEWLMFLASHCERHMLQIEEVMEDAHFPEPVTN